MTESPAKPNKLTTFQPSHFDRLTQQTSKFIIKWLVLFLWTLFDSQLDLDFSFSYEYVL